MVQKQCVILRNHRFLLMKSSQCIRIGCMSSQLHQCEIWNHNVTNWSYLHVYTDIKHLFISNSTKDCFLLVLFFLPLGLLIPLFKIPAYFSHLQLVFFDFFFCFCFGLYKCKITITIINWFILFNRLKKELTIVKANFADVIMAQVKKY